MTVCVLYNWFALPPFTIKPRQANPWNVTSKYRGKLMMFGRAEPTKHSHTCVAARARQTAACMVAA
uniref:Uncharacterized protein n=1 Tax=Magallana gigas TaxID=29159 RepID=K1Q832_MAGGI